MSEQTKGWVIFDKDGVMLWPTIKPKPAAAWYALGFAEPKLYEKKGYRCIEVTIAPKDAEPKMLFPRAWVEKREALDEGHCVTAGAPSGEAGEFKNPLSGMWHHGNHAVVCGTVRVFRADFDTNPSAWTINDVLTWVCSTLNAALRRDSGCGEEPIAALFQEVLDNCRIAWSVTPEGRAYLEKCEAALRAQAGRQT